MPGPEAVSSVVDVGAWQRPAVLLHASLSVMEAAPTGGTSAQSACAFCKECLGVRLCAGEIGDTWVFGVQSDPLKTANFRALSRLRAACIKQPTCPSDVSDVQLPAVLHVRD